MAEHEYLRPQIPLEIDGKYIYPLTTYNQIIMPDGSRWQGESGDTSSSNKDYTETDPTVPAWAKEPNPPTYTKNDVGLGNVDNVKQYSDSNPPPYPVTSVNGQTGDVSILFDGSNATSLGGVDASVYQDFMTKKTHTVTVNSSFVSSAGITAESRAGILKVGGYLQTKAQHYAGGTSTICTLPGTTVDGMAYATIVDKDNTGKAFNLLLLTENGATRVQIESSNSDIASGAWLNFTIYGILA